MFLTWFSGILYHGDLIEKLKILYKMHVMPGGCAAVTTELLKVIL